MADPGFDGGGGVDAGPPQELLGAPIQVAARNEADQLDRRDVGAFAAAQVAHLEACGLDAGAIEVHEVHRDLRVPHRVEHQPERAHARQATVGFADLARDAAGDGEVVA